jgi:two-component system, OmpR family, sensor histidine kinase ChvG
VTIDLTMNPFARPTGIKRGRISALSRQIIFINFVALAILVVGVLFIQTRRAGLVDERIGGMRLEAVTVASALAEYATHDDPLSIDDAKAEPLLRQLMQPTRLRARVYSRNGRLIVDTRNLLARNVVESEELPPLDFWSRMRAGIARVYDGVTGVRPFSTLAPYFEAGDNGRVYSEVNRALDGDTAHAERVNDRNKLVLSVAVPVQRFKAIYGVLLLSTESGDIDYILRQERMSLIGVALFAFVVGIFLSFWLSGTIARPVKLLADAADTVRRGTSGRETIPSLAERNDEIGDLAESLSAMTRALYDRIDAIESFAVDVAHELKNPLTSLKSAIEMLARAEDDETRRRLMNIAKNDIKRIDRLITDISDVSRLDAELSRETAEPVDIGRLLETIVEIYNLTELSHGAKLELVNDLPPDAKVMARDERVGQIFRNLIDNALSFSPENGLVRIQAHQAGAVARITVEDEGPGVAPENLENIFNRFYTERPAAHGFGKNTGLGLSIARQIVEGVGGRIWAEMPIGHEGARFVVELPLAGGVR